MRYCAGTLHPVVRGVNHETILLAGQAVRRTNHWILEAVSARLAGFS